MILRFAAIAALSLGVFGGLRLRHAPPDLSSPKATVRSFVAGIVEKDSEKLAGCVKTNTPNQELLNGFKNNEGMDIQISDIVGETEGNTARVAVEFKYTSYGKSVVMVDFLKLEKIGEEWKIIPQIERLNELINPDDPTKPPPHMLGLVASMIDATDETMKAMALGKLKAMAISSLSNGKQLGTALMMYIQDYDEIMPYPAKDYKNMIYPYVKDLKVFHSPAAPPDEKVSYTFNKNLEGIPQASIASPAETVMLYEGTGAKPEYRYEGKTVITFADGHAKLMTSAEVAKLTWSNKNWTRPIAEVTKPKPITKKKQSGSKTKTRKHG